jgi:thiamine kinase-like enzyme
VIDRIAARVWPGGVDSIEPLGGGITNHNFKVTVGGESFVLRIGGNHTELLGIDRRVEYDASLAAAEQGVGPEVVALLEPEGYLVTRFIDGVAGRVEPAQAAALLRRFHRGRRIAGRFDVFRVVETYAETARERGRRLPRGYGAALDRAAAIAASRSGAPLRPCHDDLLPGNFVDDGERTWIVDWEYAGMGDPAFAVNNGLDEDGDRALLAAYGGGDLDAHVLMRFMSDFREAMWGVVQQAISELEFDFAGYADEHFERLERTATEARFGEAFARIGRTLSGR